MMFVANVVLWKIIEPSLNLGLIVGALSQAAVFVLLR